MRDAGNTWGVLEVLKGPRRRCTAGASRRHGEHHDEKAQFAPEVSADLSLGSFQTRRAASTTGPLSDTVAYRLNAAHEAGHSFRDTVKVRRSLFSPSFLWLAGEHTTVSYEIEAVRQRRSTCRGVVASLQQAGSCPCLALPGRTG